MKIYFKCILVDIVIMDNGGIQ